MLKRNRPLQNKVHYALAYFITVWQAYLVNYLKYGLYSYSSMSFLEWFRILKLEHRIRQILQHPVFLYTVAQGGGDRAIGAYNHNVLIGLEGLIVGGRFGPPSASRTGWYAT